MRMEDATNIAVACIRAAGNFQGVMRPQNKLRDVRISAQNHVDLLRNHIVNNNTIGVPSVNHTLDPVFLQALSGSWTVIQLILQIYNNSTDGRIRPAEVRAASILENIQSP